MFAAAASALTRRTISLPSELETAARSVLAGCGLSGRELRENGAALTEFLHTRNTPLATAHPMLRYQRREGLAFLMSRMPSSFVSTSVALHELRTRAPQFVPETVLDFGSGVGTTLWAVQDTWETWTRYTGVDISLDMINIALDVKEASGMSFSGTPRFQEHFPFGNRGEPADLVVAAHTLSELPSKEARASMLAQLWEQTRGALVLVELGNSPGFQMILEARQHLLGSPDASIIAPCPHNAPCPKADALRPCHVPFRVQIPIQQHVSRSTHESGHAKEKMSYLVAVRVEHVSASNETASWPRIVAAPKQRSGHIHFDICHPEGVLSKEIRRRSDGTLVWTDAKKREWGELLPSPSHLQTHPRGMATPKLK